MKKCDFCGEKCDGKLVLRDMNIQKKDGSDIELCSICLNLYANHKYDKLTARIGERIVKESE